MKKSIPPIKRLEELNRRYDGPIPREQLRSNAVAWQVLTYAGRRQI